MPEVAVSPLGIIETQYYTFGLEGDDLLLESGRRLGPVTIAYQTYGKLSPQRDNAILICHALSGDAHVAGNSAEDGRLGWWEVLVGPGKPLDTDRYFIICSNVLAGCKGTTGPASINPATGKPYALSFPIITIEDMVKAQKRLVEALGIERLLTVIGGSMGGMQALSWSVQYPEMVASAIPIATASRLTAQGIAWDEIGRRAIMADQYWDHGNYYEPGHPRPEQGMAVARMVGHITYLSEESMQAKFGRQLRNRKDYSYSFDIDFQVESYLQHQGESFNRRFDPNSYLYITRAMDYFDLTRGTDSLVPAFAATSARYLFISFSSDWLYPPEQSREMVAALYEAGRGEEVEYFEAISPYGHDAFLLEAKQQGPVITEFLERVRRSKF
ncbi:MAG TPA: homoserine O-acetyltransferase [Chloroflexia bacterium]|nr:homoserine O-acetyltransferase [Chloroflexia bacterium]